MASYGLNDDEALAVLATVRLYEQTSALVEAVSSAQEDGDARHLAGVVSEVSAPLDPARSYGDSELEPGGATVRAILQVLAEPAVAAAVLVETGPGEDLDAVALGLFAESIEPVAPRVARPALLERFRPAPHTGLGRNDPCWCGSGRKYKVCHVHREQLPLAERAAWLYQKAGADLFDGAFGPMLIDTAQARAQYSDSPDALDRAIADGLIADAVPDAVM